MEPAGAVISWRRLSYFLSILLLIQCFFLYYIGSSRPHALTLNKPLPKRPTRLSEISPLAVGLPDLESVTKANVSDEYFFNEHVDVLSAEQCKTAFPDLYYEAERSSAYWRNRRHLISSNDIWADEIGGSIRFLIHRNELRIINSTKAYSAIGVMVRAKGITELIYRAVESARAGGEALPTIEFSVSMSDISEPPTPWDTYTTWTWARAIGDVEEQRRKKQQRLWVLPNFDHYAMTDRNMGAFEDVRYRAFQHDSPLPDKIPKAVWRGTLWVNPALRGGLINTTVNASWADVREVEWGTAAHEGHLKVDQFCDYHFAVHTEGISFSGRLKFLLNCDNVIIMPELTWTEHYYHLLMDSGPQQNYVKVKRDWSDLEEKIKFYLANPFQSNMIVKNHKATFRDRYLTRAATSCYLRRLIQEYGSVSFRPPVDEEIQHGNRTNTGKKAVRKRGISFEELMLAPRDFANATDYHGKDADGRWTVDDY